MEVEKRFLTYILNFHVETATELLIDAHTIPKLSVLLMQTGMTEKPVKVFP